MSSTEGLIIAKKKVYELEDLPFIDFVVIYNFHKDWKRISRIEPGIEIDDKDSIIYCRFTFDEENDIIRKSILVMERYGLKTEENIDGDIDMNYDKCQLKIKGYLNGVKNTNTGTRVYMHVSVMIYMGIFCNYDVGASISWNV